MSKGDGRIRICDEPLYDRIITPLLHTTSPYYWRHYRLAPCLCQKPVFAVYRSIWLWRWQDSNLPTRVYPCDCLSSPYDLTNTSITKGQDQEPLKLSKLIFLLLPFHLHMIGGRLYSRPHRVSKIEFIDDYDRGSCMRCLSLVSSWHKLGQLQPPGWLWFSIYPL